MKAEKWRRLVEPHFAFLGDYGFRLEGRLAESSFWSTRVVYAREEKVAVAVRHSTEFNRAEVSLVRLHQGEMPEPQVWVTDEPISSVLLDNVLSARAPERYQEIQQLRGLGMEQLEEQLSEQADALRSVAADFLRGSLAAMEDGERVIRQALEANPQELVVWLPEDATAEAEQRAIEDATTTAPPDVNVSAKRYRRPS